MSIRFQVITDGYEQTYTNGATVVPILNSNGVQRVALDVAGSSLSSSNPLPTADVGLPSAAAAADATSNPTVTQIEGMNMTFNGSTWDRARSGLSTAQSAATGMQNTLPTGKYNASAPSLSDGQFLALQLNSEGDLKAAEQFAAVAEDNTNGVIAMVNKPLATSTYAPSLYSNFAGSVTGAAIKASAGNCFTIMATNANAAVRYLQLHNATAKPAGGAVPVLVFAIPASGGSVTVGSQLLTNNGVYFSTGITWAISTTIGTFTDSATASEHTVQSVYK